MPSTASSWRTRTARRSSGSTRRSRRRPGAGSKAGCARDARPEVSATATRWSVRPTVAASQSRWAPDRGAEAAVVRRIFERFAAGMSANAIAKRLNAEGVPGRAAALARHHDPRPPPARHRHPQQRALHRPAGLEPAALRQGPGDRQAPLDAQSRRATSSSRPCPTCGSSTTSCGTGSSAARTRSMARPQSRRSRHPASGSGAGGASADRADLLWRLRRRLRRGRPGLPGLLGCPQARDLRSPQGDPPARPGAADPRGVEAPAHAARGGANVHGRVARRDQPLAPRRRGRARTPAA